MRGRINTECGLMTAFSRHRGPRDSKMRVLIVCTAILAYANAAPSHFLPLTPLRLRTIAYPAAIPTISSGDIQAAAIDAHVKYADLAQAAVDNARQISEQAVEDLNVKAYSTVAANQENINDGYWATEDKKWQTLDAIKTAEAQLDGALASNAPVLAKGAALGPYVAAVSPYSAIASYSSLPTISSGDVQAAAIDAHVKYADLAQAAVDKARQVSETAQAKLDSAIASNVPVLAKGVAVGPYVAAVSPYSAIAPYSVLPTISSGDIQAAAIDTQVKYADLAQAAVDKARLLSETAQAQFDGAVASNVPVLAKGATVGPYVAAVSPYSTVASYSPLPTISSGDIQAAAIDAHVKYADLAQAAVDKARQISETSQAQLDGTFASNAPALAKNALLRSYVAAVAPYSAVAPNTPVVYPGFVAPAVKSVATQFNSEISKVEGEKAEAGQKVAEANVNAAEATVKSAEASLKSIESEKFEIEKSVKSAEAALETAKSEADKAFAALHTSQYVAGTVGLTNAYLTPSIYSSVAFGQPILDPLHHIAPVVGPTYLKTLC